MKSLSAVAVLSMLAAGSAGATNISYSTWGPDGASPGGATSSDYSGLGVGPAGLGACISAQIQGRPQWSDQLGGCTGDFRAYRADFSQPVNDVILTGSFTAQDVSDGAVMAAFDASGNVLGYCYENLVFDASQGSLPAMGSKQGCATFQGVTPYPVHSVGWTTYFTMDLAMPNISFIVFDANDDGRAGVSNLDPPAVPEPSTFYLLFLGLSVLVWLSMRRHYLDTRRAIE